MKNTIKAKNKRPGSNKATGRDYCKKYRADLNKANRKSGTYGNKDGMDKSHTKSGKMVSESQSKNRARNRGKK
jgi:hypothetical protein